MRKSTIANAESNIPGTQHREMPFLGKSIYKSDIYQAPTNGNFMD